MESVLISYLLSTAENRGTQRSRWVLLTSITYMESLLISYLLSTAENELGVVVAHSEAGGFY